MGMRCSQPQGLPAEAEKFLSDNAVRINECQHCRSHDGYKKKVIGKYGMFDELHLCRYTLLDGSTADEFIQQQIWDSGPIIWLGLKCKDDELVWDTKEVMSGEEINDEVNNDDELADYGMSQEASYYEDVRRRNESHEQESG